MVQPMPSTTQSTVLAHDIAKQIEDEMQYPGQIHVVVIRESCPRRSPSSARAKCDPDGPWSISFMAHHVSGGTMSADDLIDFVESVSGDAHLCRRGAARRRFRAPQDCRGGTAQPSTISAASRTSSSKCSGTPATRMRRASFRDEPRGSHEDPRVSR